MNELDMLVDSDQNLKLHLIDTIPAPGLGDEKSSISAKRLERMPEMRPLLQDLKEIVKSGECIVTCNHNDDGCIDGRCADLLAYPQDGEFATKEVPDNKGNERAKVAGGGLITGLAMYKALGEGLVSPESDITFIADSFAHKGIYCGAHTGAHGSPDAKKSDCGANDRFGEIIHTVIQNKNAVAGVTRRFMDYLGVTYNQEHMDNNIADWDCIVKLRDNFINSDGLMRLDAIREGVLIAQDTVTDDTKASVIKNLAGSHNEYELEVICDEGMTFSQTQLRDALLARHPEVDPDDLPQVFVLDLWRVRQLAEAIAAIPDRDSGRIRSSDEINERFSRALHAGIAYQIGTYVTLTDGSLDINVFADAV